MATTVTVQSIDQLKNQIKTSLFGRREGFDFTEFVVGPKTLRLQIEQFTTTAAATLSNFGISVLAATTVSSATYTMTAPTPGITDKEIYQTSSSTLGYAVQLGATVNLLTTSGSTFNVITFQAAGAAAALTSLSSLTWTMKFTPNTGVALSTV